MTDVEGRPISIEVFAGNTADPSAFVSAPKITQERFGLKELIMVGDRGMITSARIEALRDLGGPKWITCLGAPAIKALAEEGSLQLGLFDEVNLASIVHPDYPDERLIACRNPSLATERKRKRNEALDVTEAEFSRIAEAVSAKQLKGIAVIAKKVGKISNHYKMAKHFITEITKESFSFVRNTERIQAEAALDGIYVIQLFSTSF